MNHVAHITLAMLLPLSLYGMEGQTKLEQKPTSESQSLSVPAASLAPSQQKQVPLLVEYPEPHMPLFVDRVEDLEQNAHEFGRQKDALMGNIRQKNTKLYATICCAFFCCPCLTMYYKCKRCCDNSDEANN